MRNKITVAKTSCLVYWEEKNRKKDHITWVNKFSHFQETDTGNSIGISDFRSPSGLMSRTSIRINRNAKKIISVLALWE